MSAQFTIQTTTAEGQTAERSFAFILPHFRIDGTVYTAAEAAAPEMAWLQKKIVDEGLGVVREIGEPVLTDVPEKKQKPKTAKPK